MKPRTHSAGLGFPIGGGFESDDADVDCVDDRATPFSAGSDAGFMTGLLDAGFGEGSVPDTESTGVFRANIPVREPDFFRYFPHFHQMIASRSCNRLLCSAVITRSCADRFGFHVPTAVEKTTYDAWCFADFGADSCPQPACV